MSDATGTAAVPSDTFEKLGAFYLGREVDPETGESSAEPLLYDSKDLVTHGVVLGMTGSGKTGLCLALLEEAAIDGIPAIAIDPKGDIANLLLTFPELRPEDFRPWINEEEARRKGVTPEAFAASEASRWGDGLAEWGQDGERIRLLRERADLAVFTPGSTAGTPVSILSSLAAPPFEVADDAELLGERVESTVASLLSLLGIDADPIQSREHILLSNVFAARWREGESLTLADLIREIQSPPFTQVGVLDLESFFPEKDRRELAMRMNNLLAAPGFATWLEGEPLDIQRLLFTPEGRPRVSIFSIAHLSESERMFFVSLLLNEMLAWMRSQSGTTSLRALLYMDEIYGFLPPTQNPPSKKPMLTLLKQARAYGLGVLLATQNPVDLDYKALSNMGTWFLGRLQTERDQQRVLDGLEGASAGQGSAFDRRRVERVLAGLGKRMFLLHNVHEDGPVTFRTRWVLSYLRGPLTRRQIRALRETGAAGGRREEAVPGPVPDVSAPEAPAERREGSVERPVVPRGVDEFFLSPAGAGDCLWLPAVVRAGEAVIRDEAKGVRAVQRWAFANPLEPGGERIDWDDRGPLGAPVGSLVREGTPGPDDRFGALAPCAIVKTNYTGWKREFVDWFYREGGFRLLKSPTFRVYSRPGEGEADFRARLRDLAREERDRRVEELRERFGKKITRLEERLARAREEVDEQKEQASSARLDTAVSIGSAIFGALLGRKRISAGTLSRGRGAANRASRAWREGRDVERAEERAATLEAELEDLEAECRDAIDEAGGVFDAADEPLDEVLVSPLKRDIVVKACGLVWRPFREGPGGALVPAWQPDGGRMS